MTKIIWLNQFKYKENTLDRSPISVNGGAEITIKKHIEFLRGKGYQAEVITPYELNKEMIDNASLIIMSNIVWSNKPGTFRHKDLDYIVDNKPFVMFSHDALYCEFRNPDCTELPYKESIRCPHRLCNNQLRTIWFRKVFEKSKLNVFLSPLQLNDAKKFFWKELNDDRTVVIPPCIKKEDFKPSPTAIIKGTYCVLGAIYPGKGIQDILDNYKELGKNLRFIGPANHPGLIKAIVQQGHTMVDPVKYEEIPNILQKYEHMIISRRIKLRNNKGQDIVDEKGNFKYTYMKESFGRIIAEAKNIGVNIIVDKDSKSKIGFYSYNLPDEELLKMCNDADKTLYDELNKKLLL